MFDYSSNILKLIVNSERSTDMPSLLGQDGQQTNRLIYWRVITVVRKSESDLVHEMSLRIFDSFEAFIRLSERRINLLFSNLRYDCKKLLKMVLKCEWRQCRHYVASNRWILDWREVEYLKKCFCAKSSKPFYLKHSQNPFFSLDYLLPPQKRPNANNFNNFHMVIYPCSQLLQAFSWAKRRACGDSRT